jgi:hypothetical protein
MRNYGIARNGGLFLFWDYLKILEPVKSSIAYWRCDAIRMRRDEGTASAVEAVSGRSRHAFCTADL